VFRKPVRVGDELRVVGQVARQRSRAIETHGTVARARDGEVLAEADATFLVMPAERRRELERRYSRTDEAFARLRDAVDREHVEQNGKKEHLRT
jgi:acyl-CoA thioesterase FadM